MLMDLTVTQQLASVLVQFQYVDIYGMDWEYSVHGTFDKDQHKVADLQNLQNSKASLWNNHHLFLLRLVICYESKVQHKGHPYLYRNNKICEIILKKKTLYVTKILSNIIIFRIIFVSYRCIIIKLKSNWKYKIMP